MPSDTVMDSSSYIFIQSQNSVRVEGSKRDFIDVPERAFWPISLSPSGRSIVCKEEQFEKQDSGIVSTVAGQLKVFNEVQL